MFMRKTTRGAPQLLIFLMKFKMNAESAGKPAAQLVSTRTV
jgi:hypothetical protein